MQFAIGNTLRHIAIPAAFALAASVAQAEEPLALVEAYMAAWNTHDSTAAAGYLAENVSYYDATIGTPLIGRGVAKTQIIDAFINAVPDAVWSREGDALVSGNSVAMEWTFDGTNTAAWADGTAATGKTFSLHGMSMFRIEGDHIVYQADYYDALGFYNQLGLM